jgi:hypothetical protein
MMNTSTTIASAILDDTMNGFFSCKNGQNVSWTSVCDGHHQCTDGSDELNCYCKAGVYACLQGSTVSCQIACTTFGRVTCLTYQNTLACEQYMRERNGISSVDHISSAGDSSLSTSNFDALRYSAFLAAGILLLVSFVSILVYFIRKRPSNLLLSCANKAFGPHAGRKPMHSPSSDSSVLPASVLLQQHSSLAERHSRYSPPPPDFSELPPAYRYADQNPFSLGDCYEPPPYPGPPRSTNVQRSDSIYYETIKTPSTSNSMSMLHPMPLPEPRAVASARMHCV